VRQFHTTHFVASRAHLYVAGRFDAAAVEVAARQAFGAWSTGEAAKPFAAATPRAGSATPAGPRDSLTIHLLDRPGATQARIQISAPVVDPSHPDHPILDQLNLLLGSVQTSRIIANVREKHGYSYNVSSRMIRRPGSSQWALTADVATDVTAPALREMMAELARVVAEPPGDDELRRFQAFQAGLLVSENATPSGILDWQRYFDLFTLDAKYRTNFIAEIDSVLPADIQRVARTYLEPGNLTIVVVGDRSRLTTQLASLGKFAD
jgi:zinc protease